jgi:hypothetical protein
MPPVMADPHGSQHLRLNLRPPQALAVGPGGVMLYEGPREGITTWFSELLGAPYQPALHGCPADWVMDIICVNLQDTQVRWWACYSVCCHG